MNRVNAIMSLLQTYRSLYAMATGAISSDVAVGSCLKNPGNEFDYRNDQRAHYIAVTARTNRPR